MQKPWLFIFTHSPFDGRQAKEGLDVLLATAAFDQPIQLVFWGNGVYQLHKHNQPEQFGLAPVNKQLAALPMYGVDEIYVDNSKHPVAESTLPDARALDKDGLQALIQSALQVLVF
ncbi:DsrE family protein [Simiduia agarivorans]|uniref:Sulfur relay protein TusC n=1 Tax=Simiduia agarivorans (strain DSM 21679 / JCM 13881 / BCRC 17597 / SA1) TaxID=1117647 RepID=K4KVH1_SIMAS|nr:DsrE family protein [Simiduia agarivorans]AFU97952.2 sulfur relay protein TusC [Simiduia agarivorans SA1 = DSM 21679]